MFNQSSNLSNTEVTLLNIEARIEGSKSLPQAVQNQLRDITAYSSAFVDLLVEDERHKQHRPLRAVVEAALQSVVPTLPRKRQRLLAGFVEEFKQALTQREA